MTPELQTHFLNLYQMALTDSEFHEKEMALLYKLAEDKGIAKESIDKLILDSSSVQLVYPATTVDKIEYLYDYVKVILADGIVNEEEMKTLVKFCSKFQFEQANIPTISEFLIEAVRNDISKEDVLNFVTQNN
jgi:uncharacterized tellurite resistance protein B-like protein